MKNILKVGVPVALQDGFIQISFIAITIFANQRGLNDAAAVGIVEKLIVEEGECRGVVTSTGARYQAQAVVITAGTALRGEIIIGEL